MDYIKRFLKNTHRFYGKIALATGLFFIIQGLGTFYLLKDTAGRAGFELFSDLSELTFILVLLLSLLYNALYSFKITRNCRLLKVEERTEKVEYAFLGFFSYWVLIVTVTVSFLFSDILRFWVSSFFVTKDNFYRLSIFNVVQLPNFGEYCFGGPLYIRTFLIGSFVMLCSIVSFSGFVFKRNVLMKTFIMLLFVSIAAIGLILF